MNGHIADTAIAQGMTNTTHWLVWTSKAKADRDTQISYTVQHSLRAAIEQGKQIHCQTNQLSQSPEMGRPGRKRNTRELVISRTPFIFLYRITGQHIEVIRLLHSSQCWPT